jgi:GT2 family glycosyltransferase
LDSCATQADFNNAVHRIDADALIFVGPDSLLISRAWLKELFGYLTICGGVGAVGGKILDQRLRVRSGGLLLLNEVTPICCGESDESDGFWYTGRIASNVEAVSAGLLATPKAVFSEVGGIPFLQYGDLAGVAYGLRLQKAGYRVVYNPWSKIVCTQPVNHSEAVDLLEHEFGALAKSDRYYHPFFSRDQPYQLLEPRNGS